MNATKASSNEERNGGALRLEHSDLMSKVTVTDLSALPDGHSFADADLTSTMAGHHPWPVDIDNLP